jgi:hypothetical protein
VERNAIQTLCVRRANHGARWDPAAIDGAEQNLSGCVVESGALVDRLQEGEIVGVRRLGESSTVPVTEVTALADVRTMCRTACEQNHRKS